MARVREFQCDMCGMHESTVEPLKPETWVQLPAKGPGRLSGSVKETVIVCHGCAKALDKAAADLVTLVQTTIASRKSHACPSLTEGQVLSVVHKKALADVDVLDLAMNEDEDEDEDDDDEAPPGKKRRAKMRRKPGAGDGG